MEQIINYRDLPTDKRIDILNALERIGFIPAYGGVKTMQQIMEKSVPDPSPQFYFVFRENELIRYNFLIGNTKKYKAFPWLAISNMDEQKLAVCEELMKIQIGFIKYLPSVYMDCTIPRFTVSCSRCAVSCDLLRLGWLPSDSVKCEAAPCVQGIEYAAQNRQKRKKPCAAFNTQHRAFLCCRFLVASTPLFSCHALCKVVV